MQELMESPARIAEFVGRWWFVQAKGGFERRLAKEVSAKGANVWCPTEKIYRLEVDGHGNRFRRKVERLLFPGYVFLCGDEEHRYEAARSLYSIGVRDIADQKKFVRQLSNFEMLLNSDEPVYPAVPLQNGTRIIVVRGKLQGMTGKVASLVPSRLTVVVELDQLYFARGTEIAAEDVEQM